MMNPLPSGSCASGARGLSGDDVAGITAIYRGIASGPNPPAAPTALTASAALSTVNLSWTPSTSGGPAQRYLVDAGNLSSGVYNLGTSVLNSTATSATFGNVPAGTYFVRVRAQNAVGTSGPSPEAQVSVGACAAPGAPGPLSFAANDTTVNLQWSAPAGGVTQGYRFIVGSAPGLANILVQDYSASVTAIAATGVPYGTYYARVAATNVCGVSPPSNEVVVVVQPCSAAAAGADRPDLQPHRQRGRPGVERPGRRPAADELHGAWSGVSPAPATSSSTPPARRDHAGGDCAGRTLTTCGSSPRTRAVVAERRMRSWFRYRNLAAVLAAGVLLAISAPAPRAQSRPPLFTEMAQRRLPGGAARIRARRTRQVAVSAAALGQLLDRRAGPAAPFVLNLFPDRVIAVARERVETGVRGHTSWVGHVEGEPDSTVALTWDGATLSGGVVSRGVAYDLLPAGAGSVVVVERDPAADVRELPRARCAGAGRARSPAREPCAAPASRPRSICSCCTRRRRAISPAARPPSSRSSPTPWRSPTPRWRAAASTPRSPPWASRNSPTPSRRAACSGI